MTDQTEVQIDEFVDTSPFTSEGESGDPIVDYRERDYYAMPILVADDVPSGEDEPKDIRDRQNHTVARFISSITGSISEYFTRDHVAHDLEDLELSLSFHVSGPHGEADIVRLFREANSDTVDLHTDGAALVRTSKGLSAVVDRELDNRRVEATRDATAPSQDDIVEALAGLFGVSPDELQNHMIHLDK